MHVNVWGVVIYPPETIWKLSASDFAIRTWRRSLSWCFVDAKCSQCTEDIFCWRDWFGVSAWKGLPESNVLALFTSLCNFPGWTGPPYQRWLVTQQTMWCVEGGAIWPHEIPAQKGIKCREAFHPLTLGWLWIPQAHDVVGFLCWSIVATETFGGFKCFSH